MALATLKRILPSPVKAALRATVDRLTRPSAIERVERQISQVNDLLALQIYEQARQTNPRFHDPKRLLGSGFKVYSQHDEDGIIEEIFRRIGVTDQFFVEFGVGDGLENCTLYLLLKNWRGCWLEGGAISYQGVLKNLPFLLANGQLRIKEAFITMENIESLFAELEVPREFDLLSIDIDNNDLWIWKAIVNYRPRVVAIEYNASFKATVDCVVPYLPMNIWNRTNYFGASLTALERLGAQKGYSLVGCNFTGVTAFFVRNDLLGSHFLPPYTAQNHYEPPRFMVRMPNGHPTGFGPTVRLGAGAPGDALR